MLIDSSALVAILTNEDDAVALTEKIELDKERVTTPSCVWETVVNVSRKLSLPVPVAMNIVMDLFVVLNIDIVPIPPEAGFAAVEAYDRFGKGRHPASLNFGDCLSYACARVMKQPLLFKGDDFAQTDAVAV
jgi:ribonuclease VapC